VGNQVTTIRHSLRNLLIGLLLLPASLAGGAEPPPKPRLPQNLITNSSFSQDADRDGVPDGWFHSEPQYWSGPEVESTRWKELRALWAKKGAVPARIPFRSPEVSEGGLYRWEALGRDGEHAISIDQVAAKKWGEWNTEVSGIKPNTDYVIAGWRRQVPPKEPGEGKPWMVVAAFGQMVPVRGTMHPEVWMPFQVSVNSGAFKGDCVLGFIIDQAPTKVWLSRVVMFEGNASDRPLFRLGLRGAELTYPDNTAYASPDMESPLFFDLMWSLHNNNGKHGLELVVDLPLGFDLTGGENGQGLRVTTRDSEPLSIGGRAYIRRIYAVATADGPERFDSAGQRPVRLWLKTQLEGGAYRAYYHARWAGGSQAIQPLEVSVIRIRPVKRPKTLLVGLRGMASGLVASRATILTRDLPRTGINLLLLDAGLDRAIAEPLEKLGISPGASFDLTEKIPDEAVAVGRDGKPVAGHVCPSWRHEEAIKTLFEPSAKRVAQGTTTLITDLRDGAGRHCFGPRCVALFKEYVAQRLPDVAWVEPATVAREPAKHPKLHAAWGEFQAAQRADLYWALRKALDAYRKEAKPPLPNVATPLTLLVQVPPPDGGDRTDYSKLSAVFDFELIDPVMHRSGDGSPRGVGDELAKLIKLLPPGGRAGVVVSAGSWNPVESAPVVRRTDIRDQVFEAVVAGARAVVLEPFHNVDAMHLKAFGEALTRLAPFEEIISEGEPSSVPDVLGGPGGVRALAKDDQTLLLVSDYVSARSGDVAVALHFKDGTKRTPMVLVDAATGALVAEVAEDAKGFTVSLAGERTRLFYLGPRARCPIPIQP
jgi:hypothetical protein